MARRILKEGDRALRDEYKLKKWATEPEKRRGVYFRFCDSILATFADLDDPEPLTDDGVVQILGEAVMKDGSFESHVYDEGGEEFLADGENWVGLYRAGAAVIFREYLVAVEKQEWPEEENRV